MAINFPDPSASPWYNDPTTGGNGITYEYTTDGYWKAVDVTGNNAIDEGTGNALYVNKVGDDMTGNLTIATDKIELKTDGSITAANFVTGDFGFLTSNKAYGGNFSVNVAGSNQDCFNATVDNSSVVSMGWDGSITADGKVSANKQFETSNGYGTADADTNGFVVVNDAGSATLTIRYDGSITAAGGNFQVDGSGIIQTNIKTAGYIYLDSTASFASPKITLDPTDGSITAAGSAAFGTIDVSNGSKSGVNAEPFGALEIQRADGNGGKCVIVYGGSNERASISSDGSASFASQQFRVAASGETTIDSPANAAGSTLFSCRSLLNSGNVVAAIKADGSAEFAGRTVVGPWRNDTDNVGGVVFFTAGGMSLNRVSGTNGESFTIYDGPRSDLANKKVSLSSSGEAYFSGNFINGSSSNYIGTYIDTNDGTVLYGVDNNVETWRIRGDGSSNFGQYTLGQDKAGVYIDPEGFVSGQRTNAMANGNVWAGYVANSLTSNITASGNATFAGTVTANGTILTRASGDINVGDRLDATKTALEAIKTAAQDNNTDLAGLKAAIVSALAGI